tara:strand:- start:230 stop:331 length:102 start_codon:yes stop_codon:yes gene_type:complete
MITVLTACCIGVILAIYVASILKEIKRANGRKK